MPRTSQFRHSSFQPMSNAPKCKIWWDVDIMSYHISTPYNPEFVAAIKQLIPASDREFHDSTKIWIFTERFFSPVCSLAAAIWPTLGEVNIINREAAERANAPTTTDKKPMADICQDFINILPFEAAQTAYRKAAIMLHPDKNSGDQEKMSKLNVLWDRIQKEVFKK